MYLVTGASGHLGQAVINHLLNTYEVPANDIIATTREPQKLASLAAKGMLIRDANFDNEAHLTKAFSGATRLLLISTTALEPGMRIKQHLNALRAAESAGVKHVVYTSMPKATSSAVLFAPDHAATEKALDQSKLEGFTVLRNNWYFENLFFSLPQALQSGTQYSAAGKGKIAHIARNDLARAAAAALSSDKNKRTTYNLSGSKEYTTEDIAKLVSASVGKPLNVVHVPVEGLIQGMLSAGVPEGMAQVFASFDVAISKGDLGGNADDFKTLTGVEPQGFEDWLTNNSAALAAPPAH